MQNTEISNASGFGPDINWPKDFLELKLIDDCLRCGICYEYFKTVMVTPCAHSYCSICIRKYLSFKTVCPICFEEVFETNLRNNRILDRLVELFPRIRDKLIKHLKVAAIHFNCNEKVPLTPTQSSSVKKALPNETPSSSNKFAAKTSSSKGKLNFSISTPSTTLKKSEISKRLVDILGSPTSNGPTCSYAHEHNIPSDVNDVPTVPSMFLKEPNLTQGRSDGPVVSCPVCSVDIPERNINSHLDNCLANIDKPVKSPVKKMPKRNPLPKMVWHMMAEKDLRKKLKEFGLNTQGDKKCLINRIQRYIVLYNSECDSENPRSVSDIIRQVEREEKQLPSSLQRIVVTKKSDPKVIEEENKKYIEQNKGSFNKLIEAMRAREGRNIKPLRPINRLSSDDEDDEKQKIKDVKKTVGLGNPLETVDLCDSRTSSPVLNSWVRETGQKQDVANPGDPGHLPNDLSSNDIFSEIASEKDTSDDELHESLMRLDNGGTKEQSGKYISDEEPERLMRLSGSDDEVQESVNIDDEIPGSLKSDGRDASDLYDAEAVFRSSPSRPPSPSCIVTAHSDSDSEGSVSLLVDPNIDAELSDVETTTVNGCAKLSEDIEASEQEQGESEELFVPRRRSKRKQEKEVHEAPSPRRTRRRLNK